MTLRYELEPFASTGCEAARIVDEQFDKSITALLRHPRFTEIGRQELELMLADLRVDAERRLFDELRGRVRLDDVDIVDGVEP
jgi:hypothetical protein